MSICLRDLRVLSQVFSAASPSPHIHARVCILFRNIVEVSPECAAAVVKSGAVEAASAVCLSASSGSSLAPLVLAEGIGLIQALLASPLVVEKFFAASDSPIVALCCKCVRCRADSLRLPPLPVCPFP